MNCWLMLSLPSTLPLLRVLGRFPQNLPLGSCHAHHWTWWCSLVAMQAMVTSLSMCRSYWNVLGTTWRRRRSIRSNTTMATTDTRNMQLETGYSCLGGYTACGIPFVRSANGNGNEIPLNGILFNGIPFPFVSDRKSVV